MLCYIHSKLYLNWQLLYILLWTKCWLHNVMALEDDILSATWHKISWENEERLMIQSSFLRSVWLFSSLSHGNKEFGVRIWQRKGKQTELVWREVENEALIKKQDVLCALPWAKRKNYMNLPLFCQTHHKEIFPNYPNFNYKFGTSHSSFQCPENEFRFVFMFQEKGGGSVFSGMFKKSPKLSEAPRLKEVKLYILNVCDSICCAVRSSYVFCISVNILEEKSLFSALWWCILQLRREFFFYSLFFTISKGMIDHSVHEGTNQIQNLLSRRYMIVTGQEGYYSPLLHSKPWM